MKNQTTPSLKTKAIKYKKHIIVVICLISLLIFIYIIFLFNSGPRLKIIDARNIHYFIDLSKEKALPDIPQIDNSSP